MKVARYAHYNVWRAFSGAPQDVPLALCDRRSVARDDLIVADAIFDPPGAARMAVRQLGDRGQSGASLALVSRSHPR